MIGAAQHTPADANVAVVNPRVPAQLAATRGWRV